MTDNTNIEVLLPCPFCGNADVYISEPYLNEMAYWVGDIRCDACEASVSNKYLSDSSNEAQESSIAVWNRRATLSNAEPAVATQLCGDEACWQSPSVPAQQWLHIESAPKDGTRILCMEKCGTTSVLFWKNGWECDLNIIASECFRPSHWMPIPNFINTGEKG